MDADGYPTEDDLKTVREWGYERGFPALLDWIRDNCWRWPDRQVWDSVDFDSNCPGEPNRVRHMSTGGWSGNEDVVGAMQENAHFWITCWMASFRGGHFQFQVRQAEDKQD